MVDAAAAAAPSAKVGVVQADMGLTEKRSQYDEGLTRHLDGSHRLRQEDGVDFVVWSETSAMRPVRDDSYRQELKAGVARRIGVPAIFGAVVFKRVADARGYVPLQHRRRKRRRGDHPEPLRQGVLADVRRVPAVPARAFPVLYSWSPNSGHFQLAGTSFDPLVAAARRRRPRQ